jgi:hypothetical protein
MTPEFAGRFTTSKGLRFMASREKILFVVKRCWNRFRHYRRDWYNLRLCERLHRREYVDCAPNSYLLRDANTPFSGGNTFWNNFLKFLEWLFSFKWL